MLIQEDQEAAQVISDFFLGEHKALQEKLLERAIQRHLYGTGSDPSYDFRDLDESIENIFTEADFTDVKILSVRSRITTLGGTGWVGMKPLFKYRGHIYYRVRLRLKTPKTTLDIYSGVGKTIEKELTLRSHKFLNELYLNYLQGG